MMDEARTGKRPVHENDDDEDQAGRNNKKRKKDKKDKKDKRDKRHKRDKRQKKDNEGDRSRTMRRRCEGVEIFFGDLSALQRLYPASHLARNESPCEDDAGTQVNIIDKDTDGASGGGGAGRDDQENIEEAFFDTGVDGQQDSEQSDGQDDLVGASRRQAEQEYHRLVSQHCVDHRTGLPVILSLSPDSQQTATFAIPSRVYQTQSRKSYKLDLKKPWVHPGFLLSSASEGSPEAVWFCSCSPTTSNVKKAHAIETHDVVTSAPESSGCEEASSDSEAHQTLVPSCMHIRTCQKIVEAEGYSYSHIINHLVDEAADRLEEDNAGAEGDVERNSSGGRRIQGGSSAHVEHVGIFDFGKSKSVGAWQVGQDGCGLHPAIVFEEEDENQIAATWRCTSCSSPSCNHLTRLFKSQGIKAGELAGGGQRGALSKAAFQASYEKMVRVVEEEGQKVTKLRLFGMSRKKIPQVPLLRTKLVKASRASSQWPPPGEGLHLKDNDEDDVQLERDGVFVIGMGGIVVDAKVYRNSATGDYYDGCDDAIIRTSKPDVMLTHDLIEEFLNEFVKNRISMSGWFWAKMAVFKAASEGLVKWADLLLQENKEEYEKLSEETLTKIQSSRSINSLLKRPSLSNDFIDAVFDYIALCDLNYHDLFKCQCSKLGRCKDFSRLSVGYDNSCNVILSILLRFPAILQRDNFIIDPLHFASHQNCSPGFNGKAHDWVRSVNSAINEQKNRFTNRARTSMSGMGQIRALLLMRYLLATINLAQRHSNNLLYMSTSVVPLVNKTVVCDGSRTGFPYNKLHMTRPWFERDHDEDEKDDEKEENHGACYPSQCFRGAELDHSLMISDSKFRSVLARGIDSIDGKPFQATEWTSFTAWIEKERPFFMPFLTATLQVKTSNSNDSGEGSVRLKSTSQGGAGVWRHWASGAPELILIPKRLFTSVEDVIKTRHVSKSSSEQIAMHSDLLIRLIKLPISKIEDDGRERVSDELSALLTFSLQRARNCLMSVGGTAACSAIRLEKTGASTPWTNPFIDANDEFLRTGIWASLDHPVIRKFDFEFRQDLLAERSKKSSRRDASREEQILLEQLMMECERMGTLCNKYKSKQRSLSPGLFTVYCGGCGICELFELLPEAESPVTVFRTFVHRAWTAQEVEAYKKWQETGKWVDPFPCSFYPEVLTSVK